MEYMYYTYHFSYLHVIVIKEKKILLLEILYMQYTFSTNQYNFPSIELLLFFNLHYNNVSM